MYEHHMFEIQEVTELAKKCSALAKEIQDGIENYAIVEHKKFGKIYDYETDEFGNYNLIDDANSPSLLAMPYLKYCDAGTDIHGSKWKY